MTRLLHHFTIVASFVLFALLVNYPIIHFDMMYPEQPLIYIANQKIHHLRDLLNVYLHPQLMHYAIPFFRPSGHFLIYQLLTPITGWQHTRVFLAVNFMFLGLAGYYMTRVYSLLFKGYWVGGLIAFAIYLAHPSLALVKLSVLHFEFAHVFFVLVGLYYFIQFCQSNHDVKNTDDMPHLRLFAAAMIAYIIAATFKESAVMLGGVYMIYFCISKYHGQKLSAYLRQVFFNKQSVQMLMLIAVVTVSLGMYLTLAWSQSSNPVREVMALDRALASIKSFMIYIFSWTFLAKKTFLLSAYQDFDSIWRMIEFPVYITIIMSLSAVMTISAAIFLARSKLNIEYKKSFLFLCAAALTFMVIPLGWGIGAPWHFNLTLVMLGLLFGFSAEYVANVFFQHHSYIKWCGIFAALCIGLTSVVTNMAIVNNYQSHPMLDKPLTLGRNGFVNPPQLSGKLTNQSLLIVDDSIYRYPYFIGAGFYPLQLYYVSYRNFYLQVIMEPTRFFLPLDTNYNGSLFRWAYQAPDMKEELIPFNIHQMSKVSPLLIYQWLVHYHDIHYLSYDEHSQWRNMTNQFKTLLLKEQKRRKIVMRHFSPNNHMPKLTLIKEVMLPGGDPLACQFTCDRTKGCNSYSYIPVNVVAKCNLFR